jgi:archaetidylinositol phosphate synthase
MPSVLGVVAYPVRRENHGWLATIERPILHWLAARLPLWLTPDRLTGIGFFGAVIAALGYWLAAQRPAFLWLACLGLGINWFGDSLDGSVARLRCIERPRYGFFLDQSVDVIEQLLFCLGLGLSGYVHFGLAMLGLAVYFMMSILSLLSASVTTVFRLARGGVGLTELRCIFIAANALMFFVPPRHFDADGYAFAYPDFLAVAWIIGTLATYIGSMLIELKTLAREEAPRPPPPKTSR